MGFGRPNCLSWNNKQFNSICFTSFDETSINSLILNIMDQDDDENDKLVIYCYIGKEYAPTTNRLHWHGVINFSRKPRRQTICKLFNVNRNDTTQLNDDCEESMNNTCKVHYDGRKGSISQAVSYCCKVGATFVFEYGIAIGIADDAHDPLLWDHNDKSTHYKEKKDGKPVKVTDVVAGMLSEGKGWKDVFDAYPGFAFNNNKKIKDFLNTTIEPRRPKPVVFYLWGATGCGKSASAQQLGMMFTNQRTGTFDFYEKNSYHTWENYNNELVTILDDISDQENERFLFKLLDHYPLIVDVKCSSAWFTSRIVVITADRPPIEMFNRHSDRFKNYSDERFEQIVSQLLRRIDHIIHFDKPLCYNEDNVSVINYR